jgi:hypothetical protein
MSMTYLGFHFVLKPVDIAFRKPEIGSGLARVLTRHHAILLRIPSLQAAVTINGD